MEGIWECMQQYSTFLAAFIAPVTAIAVAYVAWQQYRLRKFDTRLKLYDRRIEVFDIVTAYLSDVEKRSKEPIALLRETKSASHLFGTDVVDFIAGIYSHSILLNKHAARTEAARSDDKSKQHADEYFHTLDWFDGKILEAERLFCPYLDLTRV